jgi:TRAP-type mannitol/chloroaromatic compound transport system substrate-binding protein
MRRRQFLTGGVGAAGVVGGTLAAPAVLRAQESFTWRMTNAYPPGAPFVTVGPGSPTDFVEKVRIMSQGRLTIEHYAAGELIPALEGFDAVSSGTIEMNAANSYFWSGRSFALNYFTTVPFGMSYQGHISWLIHGGGNELWNEVYEPFNCVAMPFNNTGVQFVGWFRQPIESIDDMQGLRIRIPGIAAAIYEEIGAEATLLPASEIFPALERGVIDAAEFVGPFQDMPLGFHQAASYYYTGGWHEPATTGELLINRAAWESLPEDLQEIVRVASKMCVLQSQSWMEAENGPALRQLVEQHGVELRELPDDVLDALYDATQTVFARETERDEMVRKVHESFFEFKRNHDEWATHSEGAWHRRVHRPAHE